MICIQWTFQGYFQYTLHIHEAQIRHCKRNWEIILPSVFVRDHHLCQIGSIVLSTYFILIIISIEIDIYILHFFCFWYSSQVTLSFEIWFLAILIAISMVLWHRAKNFKNNLANVFSICLSVFDCYWYFKLTASRI